MPSKLKPEQEPAILRDPSIVWYGPHLCEDCWKNGHKRMVVKTGNGALELTLDADDHNHHYPNHIWKQHVCGSIALSESAPPPNSNTTMTYLPHQQRVVDEKSELDLKCEKLNAFICTDTFGALPLIEQELLTDQLRVMDSYSAILGQRIARFNT